MTRWLKLLFINERKMMQRFLIYMLLFCSGLLSLLITAHADTIIFNDNRKSGKILTEYSETNTASLNDEFSNSTNVQTITSNKLAPVQKLTESGLIFEKAFKYRIKNNSYTDVMQLLNLSDKAHAIQFRLLVNKSADDSTILSFESLRKGTDISDTSWTLDYNIIRGPILPNGASKDEIFVLIYNLNQNGGLNPGNYTDLIRVKYKVVDINPLQDSVKSSIRIVNASASTSQGFPINITPSRDEFKIIVRGTAPIIKTGLVFEKDTVYRLEDDSYVDNIQLKSLMYKVQALQFRLLVNKSIDDNVILTFQNLQKGSDISDESWVLSYNVFRGPLTGNGASVDEIYVLLFNLNYNNGLNPGNYNNLLKVKYRVADLPALQDSIKSSIKISNVEASTYEGFPVDITPSRDELTVIARNRVGFYGDVNGDGCLDILDIIMVVDHIVGRDSLDENEFQRADLAPWIQGNENPNPDGIVNVQDLSLLQNIILTGFYPNGIEINDCSYTILHKQNDTTNSKVTFYINNNGITAYSNLDFDIRGAQIEFGNVFNDPSGMYINTDLGEGYYLAIRDSLRILLYDRHGEKIIKSGDHLLADIPFNISNPELVNLTKIILIDANRQKITNTRVEIIYGNPPTIPLDYVLYQNFPNPFNPNTTIQYSIPKKSNVTLRVYDLLGIEVATLVNEEKNRGTYSLNFKASGLSTGVYFYRLQADAFVQTKKMLYLK
jgi:hypothetical protein